MSKATKLIKLGAGLIFTGLLSLAGGPCYSTTQIPQPGRDLDRVMEIERTLEHDCIPRGEVEESDIKQREKFETELAGYDVEADREAYNIAAIKVHRDGTYVSHAGVGLLMLGTIAFVGGQILEDRIKETTIK